MLQIYYSTLLYYYYNQFIEIDNSFHSTSLQRHSTFLKLMLPPLNFPQLSRIAPKLSTTSQIDPDRHKMPSSRLQLHTIAFVSPIAPVKRHLSLTTRPNRRQITEIDSQSFPNRLHFAAMHWNRLELNSNRHHWSRTSSSHPELIETRLETSSHVSLPLFSFPNLLQSPQMVIKCPQIVQNVVLLTLTTS